MPGSATVATVVNMAAPDNCQCIICIDEVRHDDDRQIVAKVTARGHHTIGIIPTAPGDPAPYVFTVGVWHSHHQPELALYGVNDLDTMTEALNAVTGQIATLGRPLRPHDQFADVLSLPGVDEYRVKVLPVHPSWYDSQFGTALYFNAETPVEFYQVVWPDGTGRFPGEAGFDEHFSDRQPQMWLPVADHPPTQWVRDDMRTVIPTRFRTEISTALRGWQTSPADGRDSAATSLEDAIVYTMHWVYQQESRYRYAVLPEDLVYVTAKALVQWQERTHGSTEEPQFAAELAAAAQRLLDWDDLTERIGHAHMKTRGTGVFDNDTAALWVRRFDDTTPEHRQALITQTFARVNNGVTDITECDAAVAAAAVVAATLPDGPTLQSDLGPASLDMGDGFDVTEELRAQAVTALRNVLAPPSAWSQVWVDSDVEPAARWTLAQLITDLAPYRDWARHRRLEDAAPAYLRDPALALECVRGVVDFAAIQGFVMNREVHQRDWGRTLYQEIAATDGSRLIIWMGDDIIAADDDAPAPGLPLFQSEVRVLPLSWAYDVSTEINYGTGKLGECVLHSVELTVSVGVADYSKKVAGNKRTNIFSHELYFTKSLSDGGHDQMLRLIDFGRLLSKQVHR